MTSLSCQHHIWSEALCKNVQGAILGAQLIALHKLKYFYWSLSDRKLWRWKWQSDTMSSNLDSFLVTRLVTCVAWPVTFAGSIVTSIRMFVAELLLLLSVLLLSCYCCCRYCCWVAIVVVGIVAELLLLLSVLLLSWLFSVAWLGLFINPWDVVIVCQPSWKCIHHSCIVYHLLPVFKPSVRPFIPLSIPSSMHSIHAFIHASYPCIHPCILSMHPSMHSIHAFIRASMHASIRSPNREQNSCLFLRKEFERQRFHDQSSLLIDGIIYYK